jgi:hypothetical protein
MQITTAKMDVILPDGENVDIDMHDESEAVVVDGTSVSTGCALQTLNFV